MDFDASRPIWSQLWEEFTKRIVIGGWAPDKQIPGARGFAIELGIDPDTVQRTLAELERGGLCHPERAVGRFTTDDAERVSRLRCDLAAEAADEFIIWVKGFGLLEVKTVALIAEGWNQQ